MMSSTHTIDECTQIWRQLGESLHEFSILDTEQTRAQKRVTARDYLQRYNKCMDEKCPGMVRRSLRQMDYELLFPPEPYAEIAPDNNFQQEFPPEFEENHQQHQQNQGGGKRRKSGKKSRKHRRRRNTRRRVNRRH